jgi:hypothetical protein
MEGIRRHLSFANVASAIALFVALGGGTAVALNGSNRVQSDDLGPGAQVKAPDVADNAVDSADIKNGQVPVLDTSKTIPSVATVTGLLGASEYSPGVAYIREFVDFHGLRAPKALTSADVNFDGWHVESSGPADTGETSLDCDGSVSNPKAPKGQVCIYLSPSLVDEDSAKGLRVGSGTGVTDADRYGFRVDASSTVGSTAQLQGTWAARAP